MRHALGLGASLPLPVARDDLLVELKAACRLALKCLVVDAAPVDTYICITGTATGHSQRQRAHSSDLGQAAEAEAEQSSSSPPRPLGLWSAAWHPSGEGAPVAPHDRRHERAGRASAWPHGRRAEQRSFGHAAAQAEAWPVALCPLEVVLVGPVHVRADVAAAADRLVHGAQAAREVAHAPLVMQVSVGGARLRDENGQPVPDPAQGRGRGRG